MVWLINGLFCKILNLVPRHQQVVSRILGRENGYVATKTIGILKVLMFVWILSKIRPRLIAVVQIIIIAFMNIIEFNYVPDLLLFGRTNFLIALFFIFFIFLNEFIIKPHSKILN